MRCSCRLIEARSRRPHTMRNVTRSHRRTHCDPEPVMPQGNYARLRHRMLLGAFVAVSALACTGADSGAQTNAAATDTACAAPGNWFDGKTGRPIDHKDLFRDLADKNTIVLLGESHTSPDHHFWQAHTLAGLRARTDNLAI